MAEEPDATSGESWEPVPGERSWERIARKRRLRARLEREITEETPAAVDEAEDAGVRVAELARLWGVTEAWIYTVAPRRKRDRKQS